VLERWATETPRTDALSELDTILEGQRPSVAEATRRVEELILWVRRRSEGPAGFAIAWIRGVERAASALDYRSASAPSTHDAGTVRVRFRAVPDLGIRWPLGTLMLLSTTLVVARVLEDPRWLCGLLFAGLSLLVMHAQVSHELLIAPGALRLSRGALWKRTLELDPATRLHWIRVQDSVGLFAIAPQRRVLIGWVSPGDQAISELPSLLEAFRSLEGAYSPPRVRVEPSAFDDSSLDAGARVAGE